MYTIKKLSIKLIHACLTGLFTLGLISCGGGGGGGPTTPGVASVNPSNGVTNVDKTTDITATFRDGMDEVDLAANIQAEFTLVDNSLTSISGVAAYDDTLNVANFDPEVSLGVLKGYTASIGAGGTITHSGGTVMPEYTWSFTTAEGAWGTAESLELDDFASFTDPTVAVAGNGDAIAIWMSLEISNPSIWRIHYNKYSSSTGIWEGMQTLTSSSGEAVSDLRIAMDNNGNAMAVWRQDPAGTNLDLMASYYDGTLWGAPEAIDAGGGQVTHPQVVFGGSGNAIAVFIHSGSVYANRYSGGLWAGAQELDAGADAVNTPPKLAVFDNGNAIVVWAQYNVAATYDVIYANHYDVGGGTWGGATSLQNSTWGAIPQVDVGDGGDAIVLWIQGSASPYNAVATVYNGATWEAPQTLDSNIHQARTPQIGVDAAGNGIAMWRADPLVSGTPKLRYDIYTSGSGWSGSVSENIDNSDNKTSDYPKLIMDDEGHAIAIWVQDTDDSTAVSSTWSNRYRAGSGWGTPERLETVDYSDAPTNSTPAPVSSPNLGMNKYNGTAFAIWLQDQDGFTVNSVWVNHFD